ncbi:site-specific integrase [Pilimelia anulata]|uniref:Site-specific integrase n=1 Tax=Pilimelia anulata TaxID=53371 RepID=A0A8J3BAB5_9ACTN|nr:site-specific integrase [Pilimelia anulata]GGJ90159.1 site-specific integrase [Pilimelia anulata]
MAAPDRSIAKRCTCRDANGKSIGATCPKLHRGSDKNWSPHHGTWTVQVELPPTAAGTRRQFRRSGYSLREEAVAARDAVRELLGLAGDDPDTKRAVGDLLQGLKQREPLPDRDTVARRIRAGVAVHAEATTGDYLVEWLTSRRRKLSPKTYRNYDDHIRLYFTPAIGELPLQKLRTHHLISIFDAIDDRNAEILEARESADPKVRASIKGQRIVGPASQQRIKATIRKALNDAIRIHRLLEYNPAVNVELTSGASPKPRLWTKAAVAKWERTGVRPSPVMVWTAEHFGTFLDYAEAAYPDLAPVYEVMGHRGLRRGEACGLPDDNVDLVHGQLGVEQQITSVGYVPITKTVKTRAGARQVALGDDTTCSLRRYKTRRSQRQLAAGAKWVMSGLFFVRPDGSAWHPEQLSRIFYKIVAAAGLPPVRLHDLRHLAATLMLATGATLKEIQETLGHANYRITADLYTSVLEELQKETANKVTKLVPRSRPKAA